MSDSATSAPLREVLCTGCLWPLYKCQSKEGIKVCCCAGPIWAYHQCQGLACTCGVMRAGKSGSGPAVEMNEYESEEHMKMVALPNHGGQELVSRVAEANHGERRGPGESTREARSINRMPSTTRKSGQSRLPNNSSVLGSRHNRRAGRLHGQVYQQPYPYPRLGVRI